MLEKLDIILALVVLASQIIYIRLLGKKKNGVINIGTCLIWVCAEVVQVVVIIIKIHKGDENVNFVSLILAILVMLFELLALCTTIRNKKEDTNHFLFEFKTCTFENVLTNQNQKDKYLFLKDLLEKEETSLTKEEKDAWLYFINDVYKKYDENTTAYAHLLLCDVVSERDNTMYNKFPQFVRDNYKFKEPYQERKKVADELYNFLYNTVGITDDMSIEEANKKMEEYQKMSHTQEI